jgi:hypothetical protein
MSDLAEFLTAAELHDLTGYSRAKEQKDWLAMHDIPYLFDGRRVVVSRFLLRERMQGREVVSSSGPNWGAMGA